MPKEGPLVICGTHRNQSVDPILLYAYSPRMVHFVIADSGWKDPYLSLFLGMLPLIPIKRSIDYRQKGSGEIISLQGNIMKGTKTSFTTQSKANDIIQFDKKRDTTFIITKVVDNQTLEVKNKKDISFANFNLAFNIMPKFKQKDIYDNAWKVLKKGGCIGIFPEGMSCDIKTLLPIRAGVSIFCFGAKNLYGVDTQLMTCGMNGYKLHKFRSTMTMDFGKPFCRTNIKGEMERFNNPETKKETISNFLNHLENEMKEAYIYAPSYEQWKAIYFAKRLIKDTKLKNKSEIESLKLIRNSLSSNKNSIQSEELIRDLSQYHTSLKEEKVFDWQLSIPTTSAFKNMLNLIFQLIYILGFSILSIPAVLYALPQRIILHKLALKMRKKSIGYLGFRVNGNDVIASVKFLAGVPVVFIFMFLLIIVYFKYWSHLIFQTTSMQILTLPLMLWLFGSYVHWVLRAHTDLNTSVKTVQILIANFSKKDRLLELRSYRERLVERISEHIENSQ